jgi:hypothetical protein
MFGVEGEDRWMTYSEIESIKTKPAPQITILLDKLIDFSSPRSPTPRMEAKDSTPRSYTPPHCTIP